MSQKGQLLKSNKFEVLWKTGQRSIPTLMKNCSISQATAYRYANNMKEKGLIERKGGSGGHNKTSETIQKKVIKKPDKGNRPPSIQDSANACNLSDQTVRNIAKEHGYRWMKLRRKALTSEQRELRVIFCKQMLFKISDIPYIVWTDETSFWLNKTSPLYGWVNNEDEGKHDPLVSLSKEKVNVWGAVTANGRISLHIFEENLDAPLYVEILKKKIREMRALYPEGFYFMCDNDSKHTSDLAIKYIMIILWITLFGLHILQTFILWRIFGHG